MSIQKFRSFEEAGKALIHFHPNQDYYRMLSRFYDLASRLNLPRHPRGIFKFPDLESANRYKMDELVERAIGLLSNDSTVK